MTLLKPVARHDGRFFNPVPTSVGGLAMAFKILPAYLRNREEVEPAVAPGPFVTDPSLYSTPPPSGLRVTWFGHSASLVEIDGVRVLIDPVWEQRASPVQWAGPKRFFPPTLPLHKLPPIDVVLISHDHYDHLGARTVRALAGFECCRTAVWITPLGVGRWLRQFGVGASAIRELDWMEATTVNGLKVTAVPARHFSGRRIWDRFKTLWASFALEGSGGHRVFYGGDSGPWPGFAEIGEHFGPFDLTMLEIGASSPLWAEIHLGPDNAIEAHRALGGAPRAGLLMPIHWGLFNLALHGWRQPIKRLIALAQDQGVSLWSPPPGLACEVVPGQALQSAWWKQTWPIQTFIVNNGAKA